jgi:hypothetical protein
MKLKAVKHIPENYSLFWKFDLNKVREQFWLNFFAFALLFFSLFVFGFLIFLLRPGVIPVNYHYVPPTAAQGALFIAKVIAVMVVMVPLHEGFHGIFFWIFSRTKPQYSFKIYYASAAAPGWYFPRWQYLIISLAPVVGITTLAIAGIAWLPVPLLLPLYFLLILNTTGSVGDLWVVFKLLFSPSETMIRDFGGSIEYFKPDPNLIQL